MAALKQIEAHGGFSSSSRAHKCKKTPSLSRPPAIPNVLRELSVLSEVYKLFYRVNRSADKEHLECCIVRVGELAMAKRLHPLIFSIIVSGTTFSNIKIHIESPWRIQADASFTIDEEPSGKHLVVPILARNHGKEDRKVYNVCFPSSILPRLSEYDLASEYSSSSRVHVESHPLAETKATFRFNLTDSSHFSNLVLSSIHEEVAPITAFSVTFQFDRDVQALVTKDEVDLVGQSFIIFSLRNLKLSSGCSRFEVIQAKDARSTSPISSTPPSRVDLGSSSAGNSSDDEGHDSCSKLSSQDGWTHSKATGPTFRVQVVTNSDAVHDLKTSPPCLANIDFRNGPSSLGKTTIAYCPSGLPPPFTSTIQTDDSLRVISYIPQVQLLANIPSSSPSSTFFLGQPAPTTTTHRTGETGDSHQDISDSKNRKCAGSQTADILQCHLATDYGFTMGEYTKDSGSKPLSSDTSVTNEIHYASDQSDSLDGPISDYMDWQSHSEDEAVQSVLSPSLAELDTPVSPPLRSKQSLSVSEAEPVSTSSSFPTTPPPTDGGDDLVDLPFITALISRGGFDDGMHCFDPLSSMWSAEYDPLLITAPHSPYSLLPSVLTEVPTNDDARPSHPYVANWEP